MSTPCSVRTMSRMVGHFVLCAFAVAALLTSSIASASTITFDLSSVSYTTHSNPWSITSGGVTLTLSNPTGPQSPANFFTDSDGLFLTANNITGSGSLMGFDLVFSSDVTIQSYEIQYYTVSGQGSAASFDLTGGATGASSSMNNTLTAYGIIPLSSPYSLAANQVGSLAVYFTPQTPANSVSQILKLEASVNAVPEPSTCVLALAGLAAGGFSMWRRRKPV
jgi:hypothetical protein